MKISSLIAVLIILPFLYCTASEPAKSDLKPGESSKIKVSFNSTGRTGEQKKAVLVFSNDPINPTQKITIKARIENES